MSIKAITNEEDKKAESKKTSNLISDIINNSRTQDEDITSSPERFINRELSWLAFNERVLEEALNINHPLFERLRFLSICESNLEEFFMVRVAGLKGQISASVTSRSIDDLSPQQQLDSVLQKTHDLEDELHHTWQNLRKELADNDIQIVSPKGLKAADKSWLAEFFKENIFPILSPLAVDRAHPFPFIPNKSNALALLINDVERKQEYEVLILLAQNVDRFIRIPGENPRYILLEDLIMMHIDMVFPAPMEVIEHAMFRILRDNEIEIEEEAEDLVLTFESAIKRRSRGRAICLHVSNNINEKILSFLIEHLNVEQDHIFFVKGLVGLVDIEQLITDEDQNMLFSPFDPRFPERIREFSGDCFAAIRHKDIIVHHPYESFDVVVQFLRQAAADPDVVAIKQTLYRTSDNSPIVEALIEAAEAGKSVTAMVELKARFDEEANIRWARNMERAGVQVVYGFVDLKTHAKLSLVVRKEAGKLCSYAHFGTGNYNPKTARFYTDLSFFTCVPSLCEDAASVFNYMTGYAKPKKFKSLSASPINLRETMTDLIDNEIGFAKQGKPASIWLKCNALLDDLIIDKLYEASQAGVSITLVVRGICALRPGVPGLSENIRVKSVVGRFLEHCRIYCFGNGKELPSRKAKVYIASADLMPRNLDRRIEVMVPIENKTVHKQVLDQIMVANIKDQKQSWAMNPDGTYNRISNHEDDFCAHDYFMKNPSLSGRGKALQKLPLPPELYLEHQSTKA